MSGPTDGLTAGGVDVGEVAPAGKAPNKKVEQAWKKQFDAS
jgi:hypothetical protein